MIEMGAHLGRGSRYHRLGPPLDGFGLFGLAAPILSADGPTTSRKKPPQKKPTPLPKPRYQNQIKTFPSRDLRFWGTS
jgi:hypothetical protein